MLTRPDTRIAPSSSADLEIVQRIEDKLRTLPQLTLETHHVLHGGMYARTIVIPAGAAVTGVLIEVPTTLIVNGAVTVIMGENEQYLEGYHVLPASAHRKQAFLAHRDTSLTMVFPTDAESVEDAEEEFTKDAEHLLSRSATAINHTIITGEKRCQEQ